jgi:hypothetical protein
MEPVAPYPFYKDLAPITFTGKDCSDLPGLVFPDGTCCFEFAPSDAERALIARGENIRLFVWKRHEDFLQPVQLVITTEHQG